MATAARRWRPPQRQEGSYGWPQQARGRCWASLLMRSYGPSGGKASCPASHRRAVHMCTRPFEARPLRGSQRWKPCLPGTAFPGQVEGEQVVGGAVGGPQAQGAELAGQGGTADVPADLHPCGGASVGRAGRQTGRQIGGQGGRAGVAHAIRDAIPQRGKEAADREGGVDGLRRRCREWTSGGRQMGRSRRAGPTSSAPTQRLSWHRPRKCAGSLEGCGVDCDGVGRVDRHAAHKPPGIRQLRRQEGGGARAAAGRAAGAAAGAGQAPAGCTHVAAGHPAAQRRHTRSPSDAACSALHSQNPPKGCPAHPPGRSAGRATRQRTGACIAARRAAAPARRGSAGALEFPTWCQARRVMGACKLESGRDFGGSGGGGWRKYQACGGRGGAPRNGAAAQLASEHGARLTAGRPHERCSPGRCDSMSVPRAQCFCGVCPSRFRCEMTHWDQRQWINPTEVREAEPLVNRTRCSVQRGMRRGFLVDGSAICQPEHRTKLEQ